MTIRIEAVYQNGMLMPKQPISLPEGSEVRIEIQTDSAANDPLANVLGIGDGPKSGDVAQRHDVYLYGVESE